MSKSKLAQSASGFDIGQAKAIGSHFSVERNKSVTGKTQNFYSSETMNGEEYVTRLIHQ